jgi:hypothetical protein
MPRLQQLRLVVGDESLDPTEFNGRETKITRQRDWRQPELRRLIVPVDMDVRRFVLVMTYEINPVRAASQNSGHS